MGGCLFKLNIFLFHFDLIINILIDFITPNP